MSQEQLKAALQRVVIEQTYGAYSHLSNTLDKMDIEAGDRPVLKIAMLRNFTVDPIIPILKGEIVQLGFHPQFYLGEFDVIAKDVFDPHSPLYQFKPDIICLAQWLEPLAPQLVNRYASLSNQDVDAEIERLSNLLTQYIQAIRHVSTVPIIINNFMLPAFATGGVRDAQSHHSQAAAILRLNGCLVDLVKTMKDVVIVDVMAVMARVGSETGVDERYWHVGRAPIGRNALIPVGKEYGRLIRALTLKSRKCLVLDCDQVLWGGILGEDGLNHIKLGASYPGSCYQSFQEEVLNLHEQGIILALCSKNNEADVLEALDQHPDMLLRRNHFATWQINWDDKASNLVKIAAHLNIGLDSLVFVDDSEFECNWVKEQLPQVDVLCLSMEPSLFRRKLQDKGYFDTLILSEEDKQRNQMYQAESTRKGLLEKAGSLDDYLKSLQMVADIGHADPVTIPRIAQLTQKTNQFNLTTRRYTPADIEQLTLNSQTDVIYLTLTDHISEMGLVGVAIVKYTGKRADIDSLLLSCRVLGRCVEDVFLAHIISKAISRGCQEIHGEYLTTVKNQQVAQFYPQHGFELVKHIDSGTQWKLSLDKAMVKSPDCIKVNLK